MLAALSYHYGIGFDMDQLRSSTHNKCTSSSSYRQQRIMDSVVDYIQRVASTTEKTEKTALAIQEGPLILREQSFLFFCC